MSKLGFLDFATISVYLLILVTLGLYLKKKASRSIEDYFLGANKMPWWAMGVSGMSSCIDMAGTMLIVSFLFMMGPRGLFIEFRGGVVLILVFMLLWSGKWHYRSKCMTGAEWMEFRFGNTWGGKFARIISAFAAIVSTIGMLAYLIKALGMFVSMFLPFSPAVCALIMIAIATIYTIVSGFYGVIYTDLLQAIIVISAIIFISVIAIIKIDATENLSLLVTQVTGNNEWFSSSLKWNVQMPKGYEVYNDLFLLAFFYFLRNMFIGISSAGADSKYFAARNERECGTLSFLWTSLMMFRWPMMIGFAVLGIIMVNDFYPDQSVLAKTADLIKAEVRNVSYSNWSETTTDIMNNPQNYSPELINEIKRQLKDNWQTKLQLLSYHGTINSEKIVPAVILYNIPIGIRGFLLIAFIAGALSSFNASVNGTAAYFTRDIYQRYINIKARNRELILVSYLFIIVMVTIGYVLAYNIQTITHIWGWIAMGLGGGIAIPAMLKFYWWRYNGQGFAIGTSVGILAAICQAEFFPSLVEWQQFGIISLTSLAATVIGTLLTKPADEEIVTRFYKQTKPFGFWKPYKEKLDTDTRNKMEREHRNDIKAIPFTVGWQVSLFLMPMQLMIKSYNDFLVTLGIFVFCLSGMYWFWYRNLPPKEKPVNATLLAAEMQAGSK